MLTDFQKECIQKVRDHWNLIPKTETGITRWQMLPNKVALIVELFRQSKLTGEEFTKELKWTKGLINKFNKGKLPNGDNWPELKTALTPEKVKEEKEKSPEEMEKKEILLKKEILKSLSRDHIKDIGLRGETITTLLSTYPSRFVSVVLNRLVREGKLESFKSDDKKYKKYRIIFKKEWKEKVVKLLEEIGLTKGRGLSPKEIREQTNYNSDNFELSRELLDELVKENLITKTGVTKGLRFISSKFQKEAVEIFENEMNKRIGRTPEALEKLIETEKEFPIETATTRQKEAFDIADKRLKKEREEIEIGLKHKNDLLEIIFSFPAVSFGKIFSSLEEENKPELLSAFKEISLKDILNCQVKYAN